MQEATWIAAYTCYIAAMSQGIYLHIPFCSSFCSYCDFYREPYSPRAETAFVEAILTEIKLRHRELAAQETHSIYCGGGTPSLLQPDSWRELFAALQAHCKLSPDCEITAEANPDSVDGQKLKLLRASGLNRLSLGAQSFSNRALQVLGRRHDAAAVRRAVKLAREAGIDNLSLDLLIGLPESAAVELRDELQSLLDLEPQHLSCYLLTLEGGVPLQLAVEQGGEQLPDEQRIADDYLLLVETMTAAGYQHYEISNFAQPGFACRHNLNYWQQGDYLGFGPAAVSTVGTLRRTNLPDLNGYSRALALRNLPPAESEKLEQSTRCAERIMLSLRRGDGLDLEALQQDFGYDLLALEGRLIGDLKQSGDLTLEESRLRLTVAGMLRYNLIVAALLP